MTDTSFRDRPATLDAQGNRIPPFPAEVRGKWRSRRTVVQAALILVFLALPWIRVNGAPAVLVNFSKGQFAFFGLQFWDHDAPTIFFFLASAALGLALMTALFGRAWCGWTCPQTVFLDGVFRRLETWIEGGHLQRRELARADWSFRKIRIKTTKWLAFSAVTLVITHSFLAYFVGADAVEAMVRQSPYENPGAFLFIAFLSAALFFNFVWFREQLCLIVCPYGRLQSVLLDRDSVTVQYDVARGEPRKGSAPTSVARGDCVSCFRCVNVCPTGIDIRNGIQLECLACTACIDACDEIMVKVGKPKGLIRYMNSRGGPTKWWRPRVLVYVVLLSVLLGGLAFTMANRHAVDISLLRALDTPYFERSEPDGRVWVTNSYRLHVHNQTGRTLQIKIESAPTPIMREARLLVPTQLLSFQPNEFRMIPFAVELPREALREPGDKRLQIRVQDQIFEVQFVGPSL